MPDSSTPFSSKCIILGELWLNYRDDEEFTDFVEYNDLGLPLAYLLAEGIVTSTNKTEVFVNETWDLFLEALDIPDTGFTNLDEMLSF